MAKSKKKQREEDQLIAEQEMAAPKRKEGLYLICGLVFLALAIYTLIALVSYVLPGHKTRVPIWERISSVPFPRLRTEGER